MKYLLFLAVVLTDFVSAVVELEMYFGLLESVFSAENVSGARLFGAGAGAAADAGTARDDRRGMSSSTLIQ